MGADRKDRDFDQIIKGCENIEKTLEQMSLLGKSLCSGAEDAAVSLQDEVAKKHIERVRRLGEYVQKAVKLGDQRVRELEKKTRKDKSCYEELQNER